jgi:hypothetical protein
MPRGEKRRWLTKVRWADVLAFLPRGQLLPLSITSGRFLAPHCAAVLLPEKKRTVKDLLIRWSQIAKRNQVEVSDFWTKKPIFLSIYL